MPLPPFLPIRRRMDLGILPPANCLVMACIISNCFSSRLMSTTWVPDPAAMRRLRLELTFSQTKNDQLKEPMFFGQPVNVARYDQQKYDIFEKLIEKQLSFFWRPEPCRSGCRTSTP